MRFISGMTHRRLQGPGPPRAALRPLRHLGPSEPLLTVGMLSQEAEGTQERQEDRKRPEGLLQRRACCQEPKATPATCGHDARLSGPRRPRQPRRRRIVFDPIDCLPRQARFLGDPRYPYGLLGQQGAWGLWSAEGALGPLHLIFSERQFLLRYPAVPIDQRGLVGSPVDLNWLPFPHRFQNPFG
jgi:hypothetical protein